MQIIITVNFSLVILEHVSFESFLFLKFLHYFAHFFLFLCQILLRIFGLSEIHFFHRKCIFKTNCIMAFHPWKLGFQSCIQRIVHCGIIFTALILNLVNIFFKEFLCCFDEVKLFLFWMKWPCNFDMFFFYLN